MKHLLESILDNEDKLLNTVIKTDLDEAINYMKYILTRNGEENMLIITDILRKSLNTYYTAYGYNSELTELEYEQFIRHLELPELDGVKEFLTYLKHTMANEKVQGKICLHFYGSETFEDKDEYINMLTNKLNKVSDAANLKNIIKIPQLLKMSNIIKKIGKFFILKYIPAEDIYYIITYPKKSYLETGNKQEIKFLDELFKLLLK